MAERVVVVDYDPAWPLHFDALRAMLSPALGDLALSIEHVGSTAVPGLAAKPIIDIDVVIPSRRDLPTAIARLAIAGYEHRGDLGIASREAFAQPPGLPEHHLYVCPSDSEELSRHIRFRDYLRARPEDARAYEGLKRRAARILGHDREAYTKAKDVFVKELLRQAQEEASGG